MIKKKSRFWTVVFSFLPGAGHMFMGFMKLGLSFMALFFGVIFVSSWLGTGLLMLAMPILWFYSFFDAINKMSMNNDEFYQQKDYYLFSSEKLLNFNNTILKKRNLYVGILFVIVGGYLLWDEFLRTLSRFLPDNYYSFLYGITHAFPRIAVGVIILAVGILLIVGKKREGGSDNENS